MFDLGKLLIDLISGPFALVVGLIVGFCVGVLVSNFLKGYG
jgi:F0F1-type ATP synthase assembly protein I